MTEHPRRLDPIRANGAMRVEECDVPGEMTLGEWRRHCATERRAGESTDRRHGPMRRGLRRLFGG